MSSVSSATTPVDHGPAHPKKPTRMWLWPLLALPAVAITYGALSSGDPKAFENALHPTGEMAVRLMIVTMLATPLMVVFKGWRGPRWLMHHRRAFGVAAFGYAALHLAFYLGDRGQLEKVLADLREVSIVASWISFVIMAVLAATSNDVSQRWLGREWKRVQRLTYVAAGLAFVHWLTLEDYTGVGPAMVHFLPLLGLSAYRIWWFHLRARGARGCQGARPAP